MDGLEFNSLAIAHGYALKAENEFLDTLRNSHAGKINKLAAELELRADGFEALCGEIIATLVVNRERDTLRFPDEKCRETFDNLLAKWRESQAKLQGDEP